MAITLDQLVYGVKQVETGHIKSEAAKYRVVNPIGAHGAYQVMRANIPSWTKEAFGRAMTPAEFLASPKAQDDLARFRLGRAMKKHGAEGAAAQWFSGQTNPNSTRSDGHFTVRQYVDKMLEWAHKYKGPAGGGGTLTPIGLADDVAGGIFDVFKNIANGIADIAVNVATMGGVATMLTKLALPSTWIRIVCGFFGLLFLLLGLLVLGREATAKG